MPDEAQPMPKLPEPVAHAAGDWMRAITETELELIPESNRRNQCRAMYRIALYTATQMHAFRAEGVREALERAAKLCDERAEAHQMFKSAEAFVACEGCAAAIRSLAGKDSK